MIFRRKVTEASELADLVKTRVANWIKAKVDIKIYTIADFMRRLNGIRLLRFLRVLFLLFLYPSSGNFVLLPQVLYFFYLLNQCFIGFFFFYFWCGFSILAWSLPPRCTLVEFYNIHSFAEQKNKITSPDKRWIIFGYIGRLYTHKHLSMHCEPHNSLNWA